MTPRVDDAEAPLPAPRGRLFRKYVLSFVGVVSVVLLLSGLFDGWFSYRETRTTLALVQHSKAEGAAQRIEQFISEIERQIGWTTHAQWASGHIDQRRFDYVRLLRQVPAITELVQIDGQGREQLKVSRLAMDVVASGADYSADPRFIEAMQKRIWYSPVYFRKESEPYMTIAIVRAGRQAGVTLAEVNLKLIWDVVTGIRLGQGGYAYVADGQGRLIAHPDISLVLRNTDLSKLPQVLAARTASDLRTPEERATIVPALDGRSVFSAVAAIQQLSWYVFVETPVNEALEPLYDTMKRTGLLLLLGLLVAALGGVLFARRMLIPVRALAAGAERFGAGDLAHRIELHTGDELQALGDEFNRMGERLTESYSNLERKVEDRTREVSEALERQTASSEVLNVISRSTAQVQPVLDAIVEIATRLCHASSAVVLLFRDGAFHLTAAHGASPDWVEWLRQNPIPTDSETLSARIFNERRPVYIRDALDDPDYGWKENARRGNIRSNLGVPLMRQDDVVGVLIVMDPTVRAFTDKQVDLLESFADQAVIAIENVRLFDEVQARTGELQEALEQQTATSEVLNVITRSPGELAPVFDSILENATRICEAPFGVLFRYRDGALHAEAMRNVPPSYAEYLQTHPQPTAEHRTGVGRVMATKAPVLVEDAVADEAYASRVPLRVAAVELGSVRTFLAVPMLKEDALIGMFVIYRQEVRTFTPKQIELVVGFASQAAVAIENVRLLNEVQARTRELAHSVEELRALGEVSQAVNSTLDAPTVLQTIVAKAVEISGTTAGAIYVFSNRRQVFRMRASFGAGDELDEAMRNQKIGLDSPLGEAARRRTPLQIADLRDEAQAATIDLLVRAGFRALMILPLIGPDRVIGALVIRRREAGVFPERTVDLLQTFAAQSVVAIQNARLFGEIEEKSRQLELVSQHKSQFLANMSHELRTPLNAVLGYAELMADGVYGELGGKAQGVLGRIQVNGKHLLGLINDVLDLSKIEAGQFTIAVEPYSVGAMVQSVVAATESLASTKGLKLVPEVAPDLPSGSGDERRLTQVLLNIVGNAIKFTDKGEIVIGARRDGEMFELAVRDTGPGIAPENQAKIFGEFQQVDDSSTRKKGGTGLGLTISKKIVEMHGGAISVESEFGKGSTFRVRIPMRVAIKETAQ